jgi:hypothetical protein
MKREAGPLAQIPEHQTSHDGAIKEPQIGYYGHGCRQGADLHPEPEAQPQRP